MSDKNTTPLVQVRSGRRSYWGNLLMLCSIVLILAIVASPLWR
jgi:hypothetical protein